MSDPQRSVIRQVLGDNAQLSVEVAEVGDDSDLFAIGMSSHASVNVMVALEEAFGIMFPDEMLERGVFVSIDAIDAAITQLLAEAAA